MPSNPPWRGLRVKRCRHSSSSSSSSSVSFSPTSSSSSLDRAVAPSSLHGRFPSHAIRSSSGQFPSRISRRESLLLDNVRRDYSKAFFVSTRISAAEQGSLGTAVPSRSCERHQDARLDSAPVVLTGYGFFFI